MGVFQATSVSCDSSGSAGVMSMGGIVILAGVSSIDTGTGQGFDLACSAGEGIRFTVTLGNRQHGHAFQRPSITVVLLLSFTWGPSCSCSVTPRIMRPQAHSQGQCRQPCHPSTTTLHYEEPL